MNNVQIPSATPQAFRRSEQPPDVVLDYSHSEPSDIRSTSPLSLVSTSTCVQPASNEINTAEEISRLTRNLYDVREQIEAAKALEERLLDNLKRLDASVADQMPTELEPPDSSTTLPARLRIAELHLLAERKQRMEIEKALQDVERECKEPFVVPELLRAFVKISKLTNEHL